MANNVKIVQIGKISKHGNQWIIVVQKPNHDKIKKFLHRDLEQEISLSFVE